MSTHDIQEIMEGDIFVFCPSIKYHNLRVHKLSSGKKIFRIKTPSGTIELNTGGVVSSVDSLMESFRFSGWMLLSDCKKCKWGVKGVLMNCPTAHHFEEYKNA